MEKDTLFWSGKNLAVYMQLMPCYTMSLALTPKEQVLIFFISGTDVACMFPSICKS